MMQIEKLSLINGQEIPLNKFTVLVGPNNVGKSQTLRDIHSIYTKGKLAKTTLIRSVEVEMPSEFKDILANLEVMESAHNIGHHTVRGVGSSLVDGESFDIYIPNLENEFKQKKSPDTFFGNIGKFKIAYLDAGSRLQVAQKCNSFNPHTEFPKKLLQALYGNAAAESELRRAFIETFSTDIRLDYSGLTELVMRVAKEFGEIPQDPREAFPILNKFSILDDQGDGYKSFVGVVLSLLLSKERVVLLDEPEAFLHPAQARQLGYWISQHSKTVPGQIIIATHNSNFLAGILASDQDVDIYRLNRKDDITTYNMMSSQATTSLAKSPLLSSQRVLDAIFHRGVIVCEADADRAIYQTVATKELQSQEFLFIHAHNKQTIPQVVALLKDASIPVRAISDIDIVNDPSLVEIMATIGGQANLTKLAQSQKTIMAAVDRAEEADALNELYSKISEFASQLKDGAHTLAGARGALNRLRKEASNWSTAKNDGVYGVPEAVRPLLTELIDDAKKNGLYVVPVGELEKWMDLGVYQKNKWIVPALNALFAGNCSQQLRAFVEEILEDIAKSSC
jgi:energy-coupling factor transporter ATP-binding protein EcfA2